MTKPTKNGTRTATTKHYDWALLNNRDIRDKYVLELTNRFETLQKKTEKGTPNDEYENFVNAHLDAAARVPWETLKVREKRARVKTASKSYRKNPTNTSARKLKKAQYQLAGIYLKEQTEYTHIYTYIYIYTNNFFYVNTLAYYEVHFSI